MSGITPLNTQRAEVLKQAEIAALKKKIYDLETAQTASVPVTNNQMQPMLQATIKGRAAGGGTGSPQDLTGTQAGAIISDAYSAGATSAAFALQIGQSGGQTLKGDTASGGNLTLNSTAHATKGKILLGTGAAYDDANVRVGIGTQSPSARLHIEHSVVGARDDILIKNPAPDVSFYETDAAFDNRAWDILVNGEQLKIRANKDDGSAESNAIVIDRTGITIDSISLLATAIGVGTASPVAKLNVVELGESTTQTDFTQAVDRAGILITTEYDANAYTPGIFWNTANNASTKPKAGFYLKETGAGSYIYMGTSNDYVTGITNNALVIDPQGFIGVSQTAPAERLHIHGAQTSNTNGASLRMTTSEDDYPTLQILNWQHGNISLNFDSYYNISWKSSYSGSNAQIYKAGNYLNINRSSGVTQGSTISSWSNTLAINLLTGDVGIGKDAPGARLHVKGDATAAANHYGQVIVEPDSDDRDCFVSIRTTRSTDRTWLVGAGSGAGTSNFRIYDYTAGADRLNIDSSGRVGIGTTSPEDTLHVSGGIRVRSSSGGFVTMRAGDASNLGYLEWYNASAARLAYMGYGASNLTLALESSAKFVVSGGSMGVGVAPSSTFNIYDGQYSATQTNFTQSVTSAGILLTSVYGSGIWQPGLFWNTQNNNSTKPKAGIYMKTDGSGSYLYFGTSNAFGTGITNDALILDSGGNATFAGTVKTTLGSAWDLGGYTGGAPAATGYVTIKIGGVTYKLLAST